MLVSITILVFVRSIQNNLTDKKRLSLQLSAFVTLIASMHYYLMIQNKTNIDIYRYFDWFFTTPILLIDLCIILDITDTKFMFEIISYNTVMLLFGYLGELGILSNLISTIGGFIPFIILFYRIHNRVKQQENTQEQKINKNRILNIFIILWSLYGLNHMYKNELNKNGIYNMLDLLTKGIFALYIYKTSWGL